MKILKAIGAFFVRIGRWIKETAWVQPLLIVGGIFAIIFSIPYISNWVKSWYVKEDAGEVYYKQRELSCEGAKEGKSQAEDILTYMGRDANPVAGYDYEGAAKKYGEKFFLMFGYDGCPGCSTLYPAFSTAANEWKTTFEVEEDYKFYFIDVKSVDTDGDYLFLSNEDYSIYSKYSDIFTKAAGVAQESYYAKHTTSSEYINNAEKNANAGNIDEFITPTVLVVNMANEEAGKNYGIENLFFSVPEGDLSLGEKTTLNYIQFLSQAWKGTGKFSESGEDA